jgi:acyl carrier protein
VTRRADAAVSDRVGAHLRACLADRFGDDELAWIRDDEPLAAQGIGSLDVIAALAATQRELDVALPDDLAIGPETSIASIVAALRE